MFGSTLAYRLPVVVFAALLAACAGRPVATATGTTAAAEPPAAVAASPETVRQEAPGRRPFPAENRTWRLISLPLAVSAVSAHSREGYIRFRSSDGGLEGHTGCNPLAATYEMGEDSIRIRNIRGGKMPCTDAVTFEAVLIQSLSEAVKWEILPDGRLLLKTEADFPVAVFRGDNR